jgi:hypothetical protein
LENIFSLRNSTRRKRMALGISFINDYNFLNTKFNIVFRLFLILLS